MRHRPTRRRGPRMLVACAIATAAAVYSSLLTGGPVQARDFTYPWAAARAILRGVDAYAYVQQQTMPYVSALFYPLTAGVVALPFAAFPAHVAGSLFIWISVAALAFVMTASAWWPLLAFLSAPMLAVCFSVQWSPALALAALWSPVLGLVAAKPNLALPLLAFQSTGRQLLHGIVGATALCLVALALQPRWPMHWIATLHQTPVAGQYQIPILTPLGALVALAALRWRRPEGRLLLGLACMPQNGFFYDQWLVLLVAQSQGEMMLLVLTSHLGQLARGQFASMTGEPMHDSLAFFPYMVAGLYLPALTLVLRRPNSGLMPRVLERAVQQLPPWLRGKAMAA